MLTINFKGKELQLKFNYRAFFKANRLLSTKNVDNSSSNNDGAANLWVNLVTGDDTAVLNAFKVLIPNAKEEDLFDLIDHLSEEKGEEALVEELINELEQSAFFKRAAKRWLKLTSTFVESKKAASDDEKLQIKILKDTLEEVKKSLS